MRVFDLSGMEQRAVYKFLTSAITPRPIAFVSTVDAAGVGNLSPFSYFNVMSIDPPTLVFSPVVTAAPARKDTLENLRATGEAVLHIAHRALAEQLNLTSAGYPPEVDEFERAGLTPVPADLVRPPRLAEAKIAFECRIRELVPLGDAPGAGNLALAQILRVHVADDILDPAGTAIDPIRFGVLGRLGGNFYANISPSAMFEMPRPPSAGAMGVPAVRAHLPVAAELTVRELAILARADAPPPAEAVAAYRESWLAEDAHAGLDDETARERLMNSARSALAAYEITDAWCGFLAAAGYVDEDEVRILDNKELGE